MISTLPSPGPRGRSRFSKALPSAPREAPLPAVPRKPSKSRERGPDLGPASPLTLKYMHSPLPPVPRDIGESRAREQAKEPIRRLSLVKSPKYTQAPLPPLPLPLPPPPKMAVAITRRPVGAAAVAVMGTESKAPSTTSLPSDHSNSPGLSHSSAETTSTKDSLSEFESDAAGPTPPLPPKDSQRRQKFPPVSSTTATTATPANKTSDLGHFNPSPPRTEIWKRRSLSSNKSISSFADLKLQKSNGSTAIPPRNQVPSPDQHPPRSIAGRKPVPARPAPPQPGLMGNKIAKLRNRSDRGDTSTSSEQPSQNEAPPPPPNQTQKQTYSPFRRLPTPEYMKSDLPRKQVAQQAVVSPSSPFTPPDDASPPALPPKADSRTENRRPDNALERTNSESTTIRPKPDPISNSNRSPTHSRQSSETPTIIASAPLSKPSTTINTNTGTTNKLMTPILSPSTTSPLSLPSPSIRISFPTIPSPAPRGTIFPGLPLEVGHFECYQSHARMRGTKNTFCPVACMVCTKADMEMRWRCEWCCLSACRACTGVLNEVPGKDLRVALGRVGK